jgi:hypothetical protein
MSGPWDKSKGVSSFLHTTPTIVVSFGHFENLVQTQALDRNIAGLKRHFRSAGAHDGCEEDSGA